MAVSIKIASSISDLWNASVPIQTCVLETGSNKFFRQCLPKVSVKNEKFS